LKLDSSNNDISDKEVVVATAVVKNTKFLKSDNKVIVIAVTKKAKTKPVEFKPKV